jgi:hypothetical protein
VFVCGYVLSGLRERPGVAAAENVSAGIRVAYHLYQGPMAALAIVPYALIAAVVRTHEATRAIDSRARPDGSYRPVDGVMVLSSNAFLIFYSRC